MENIYPFLVQNHQTWSLDIMSVASSSEFLPSSFNAYAGQKGPLHGGHMLYLDLYKEKFRLYILFILST